MGRLSLEKALEKYYKILNPHYDMPLRIAFRLCETGGLDAVHEAFALGYVQGSKAAMAEMKRKGDRESESCLLKE